MVSTKKNITVTIKISWLLFDVMNETFLRGRTLQNKENHREIASMFASEDEENREKILRSIKRGFAEVKSEFDEYLDESSTSTDNSSYDGKTNLVLNLTMPSNFNEAATSGIGEAIHDYLKNTTIADWYLVTRKEEAEGYYVLFDFTCGPSFPSELDRIYKITDGILRSLIVKKEKNKEDSDSNAQ